MRNQQFDTLYLCCLPAEKWKINQCPEMDAANMHAIQDILRTVQTNRLILISTVDVYKHVGNQLNEEDNCDSETNHAYGKHRYLFEQFVKETFPTYHIVRLPGLFGKGLKKNVLFDFISENRTQFANICPASWFQFYNLNWLEHDLAVIIQNDLKVCNLFPEPVQTCEIIHLFTEGTHGYNYDPTLFTGQNTVVYNTHTKYASLFYQINDDDSVVNRVVDASFNYIRTKEQVLQGMIEFIQWKQLDKSHLCVSNICVSSVSQQQFASILKLYDIPNVQIAPTTLIQSWDRLNELTHQLAVFEGLRVCNFQSVAYGRTENIFGNDTSRNALLDHLKLLIEPFKTLYLGVLKIELFVAHLFLTRKNPYLWIFFDHWEIIPNALLFV
jgi:hypothetical protein